MTLPLLILIAVLSAFGTPVTGDAGGGTPSKATAAASPGDMPTPPAVVDDAGGGTPTHQ
jgi:hypothetical protein